ncbi:WXG100 family type VII secretion target [Nocardioides sp.]|uniref:WXG100 family type VII secretion target n=1 Tax=Nocardioides sp. TaxID=35761 RepID=UPI0037836E57
MEEITADHAAFRAAVVGLDGAAARLSEARAGAARSVDALLGSWSGTVATSYAEGWDAWRSGADRVLDGLGRMSRLLAATDQDLAATDTASEADLGRLAGRLGR